MLYYNLENDRFTSCLTRYEFGAEAPLFRRSLFGENPRIGHIAVEEFQFDSKTLLFEKDTGSWCFLDEVEMEVYRAAINRDLSVLPDLFPAAGISEIQEFLVKLYWLGLIKLAHRRFFAPAVFTGGPVTEPVPLFILHLTDRCNLSCCYCFADSKPAANGTMSWEKARKAVDLILEFPSDSGTIEFSGGEPLLEFDLLKKIIYYTLERSAGKGKHFRFTLQSNGTLITPDIAGFVNNGNIDLSMSLDGDEMLNNCTRMFPSGDGTYNSVMKAIKILGNGTQNFGVICVISKKNAGNIHDILDHFRELGLVRFKMNPVSRLGRAAGVWDDVSLDADEFLSVHKEYIDYAVKNPHPVVDDNTYFMLKNIGQKMHSYRCMRSQCGAGFSFFSIDPRGNLFPCDRFRDKEYLLLGNVRQLKSLENLVFSNQRTKELSGRLTEEIGICRECTFKRLCEGGCTYDTFFDTGKIKAPHPWCTYYKGIFNELFKAVLSDNTIIRKFGINAAIFNKSYFNNKVNGA